MLKRRKCTLRTFDVWSIEKVYLEMDADHSRLISNHHYISVPSLLLILRLILPFSI